MDFGEEEKNQMNGKNAVVQYSFVSDDQKASRPGLLLYFFVFLVESLKKEPGKMRGNRVVERWKAVI